MKIKGLLIASILIAVITIGAVSAAQNNTLMASGESSDTPISETCNEDDHMTVQDNGTDIASSDGEKQSLETANDNQLEDGRQGQNGKETFHDNRYYLFRGDCWTIYNNFESSAAITSESTNDLTVTGTFRTENDIVGLYWNSNDLIQHPYITYGNRSNYCDVILEFDYEMTGCKDFEGSTITIAANTGETYYLDMARFIKNSHVTLDFNTLTLLPGNSYIDKNGNAIDVTEETKLNVDDLKFIMFTVVPTNFVEDNTKYTIMENEDFTCKISNITVMNGEICNEQPSLAPHQYRLCEGYDDIYNLNPYRLSKEMRKLGYVNWVDLYIGASSFYEKSGVAGDVITDMDITNERAEKMVLNESVPLNAAFRAWLDCYSRELKNNGVENLIISVSMENLQCPQSWRQMDSNGNFAKTGWSPSTFLYSPCNDEAISYMKTVSQACLDIVVDNGLKPILQLGEAWWWWNEANSTTYFYDNSTKEKYLSEHGRTLPVYNNASSEDYDRNVTEWLNHQLVNYSDTLREVVKSDRYDNGTYMALFFPPSVTDPDRVPQMMRDVNYIKDAYTPSKLDILQIEDYDWVINESYHHQEAYVIGQELGFDTDHQHYFGGFVQNPEDADRYWKLIVKAMDDAMEKGFAEVFVWAGTQVRRDSKILGYDEDEILNDLAPTTVTSPDYVSVGEKFTIKINTQKWLNGTLNVYDYSNGEKGDLLASSTIINGSSSAVLSSAAVGLNMFYLDFVYSGGKYHLIDEIYVIENSRNITANVSLEVEEGNDANITFKSVKSSSGFLYISIDGNAPESYPVNNGEFNMSISGLANGYHTVSLKYNDGSYVDGKLVGEVYSNTFTVNVGIKTEIETSAAVTYGEDLIVTLKDSKGNALEGKEILIILNKSNHTLTTDGNGQAFLKIDFTPGNYPAEITFSGDSGHLSASLGTNIIVNKIETKLSANSVSVTYGNAANLVITLKDHKGNALAGQKVTVKLNNRNYNEITDSNGQAKVSVSLPAKEYSVNVDFEGSDIYKSSTLTTKVTVKKATAKISAKSKKFKAKKKTKKYSITLKDKKGNAIKKAKVTLKVKGKTYKATTSAKGKATFKIKKLTKKGKYKSTVRFAGNSNYNPASKKVKITIK